MFNNKEEGCNMKDLLKDLKRVENTATEKEILEVVSKKEDSYNMSHGSHNQHSSSSKY